MTELEKYDGCRVRISCKDGNVYEGVAAFCGADYNYHEYGSYEEALDVSDHLFYRSEIDAVERLEEFTSPFGKLEEEHLEDGAVAAAQALESEDRDTVCRMLSCIGSYLKSGRDFPDREEVANAVRELAENTSDDMIKDAAVGVLENL